MKPPRWYHAKRKEKFGPYSFEQLRELAIMGQVQPTSMVWQEGTQKWMTASTVPELFHDDGTSALAEQLSTSTTTAQLEKWIGLLRADDPSARENLVNCTCDRLLRLTRKMLKSYPGVARWEQTEDVFQNASIRLCRALNATTPQSARHFLNLAALHIRRELIDLARHHFGAQGQGAHHDTGHNRSETPLAAASQTTLEPSKLAQWTQFHEQIDKLPTEEREIFDLLWYQGVSQSEAAVLLNLSERTLQRRWQSARLNVFEAMKGNLPD